MIPFIIPLLFTNLILNNSNFSNVNSTAGLLQGINNGLAQNSTFPNPLGTAIVVIVFMVVMMVAAFRADLPLAAASGSLMATGTALLLQTPGIAIVGSTLVYIFAGLTLFFMFLYLISGSKSPFGGNR